MRADFPVPWCPVIMTPGLFDPNVSSMSLISQCLPKNKGSGSCNGTSKNRGFNVSWGARYCAKRTRKNIKLILQVLYSYINNMVNIYTLWLIEQLKMLPQKMKYF